MVDQAPGRLCGLGAACIGGLALFVCVMAAPARGAAAEFAPLAEAMLAADVYAQQPAALPLVEGDVGVRIREGEHQVTVRLDGGYDPFELHTFNLDSIDSNDVDRLVMHVGLVRGSVTHQALISDWGRLRTTASGAGRFTSVANERSSQVRLTTELRAGALGRQLGPWSQLLVRGKFDRYPLYRVSDRSLDQNALVTELEVGWDISSTITVLAGWELEFTQYLDARYDAVGENGSFQRASASKSYLDHDVFVRAEVDLTRVEIALAAHALRNNSRNYARAVTGLNADGASEERVYRDFFDYVGWEVDLDFAVEVGSRTELHLDGALSRRTFDTQEARDADNRFTGERRANLELDLAAGASVRVWERGDTTVAATVDARHRLGRSNMERDRSFTATYDVTVAQAGLRFEL